MMGSVEEYEKKQKEEQEKNVGEAARKAEARERNPEQEEALKASAKQCVAAGIASMGILANEHDDFTSALTTIRAISAYHAMSHVHSDDRKRFFNYVAQMADAFFRAQVADAPRIVTPGR